MADYRNFICFDFETASKYPETTQIVQIGACAIKRNSLKIVDRFTSLVRPDDFDAIEEEALQVNGLTIEQLKEAPKCEIIFPAFANWIQNYNTNKNKNSFGAPIGMHYNGDKFDMPIMARYCKRFGYWDNKWDNQTLLNPMFSFDIMQHMWFWTRNVKELKNMKLTTVLEYLGVPKEEIEKGAHDGMWDAEWTAKIGIKILNVGNFLTEVNDSGNRKLEMKDAFKKI